MSAMLVVEEVISPLLEKFIYARSRSYILSRTRGTLVSNIKKTFKPSSSMRCDFICERVREQTGALLQRMASDQRFSNLEFTLKRPSIGDRSDIKIMALHKSQHYARLPLYSRLPKLTESTVYRLPKIYLSSPLQGCSQMCWYSHVSAIIWN